MALIAIQSFGGISPKTPARYLQDTQAQVALNCPVFSGSLQPLAGLGSSLLTLGKTGVPKTIYRFGQDLDSDTQYWFNWSSDVDVCRSQIAGDTSEWTFYTGDGAPKATYNSIALSGSAYPAVSRPLGLPIPTSALTASLGAYAAETTPASVFISANNIAQVTTTYGIDFSLDGGTNYTNVPTPTLTAAAIATALAAATGITAVEEDGAVTVSTDTTGETATLDIRIRVGTTTDTAGTFTYSGYDSGALVGSSSTINSLIVLDTEVSSVDVGNAIDISVKTNGVFIAGDSARVIANSSDVTAADLAKAFTYGQIVLTATEITNISAVGMYIDIAMVVGGTNDVIARLITASSSYTATTLAAALNGVLEQVGGVDALKIAVVGTTVVISAVAGAVGDFSYSRYATNPDPGGVTPIITLLSRSLAMPRVPVDTGSPIVTTTAYGSVLYFTPNVKGTGGSDELAYARYTAPSGTVVTALSSANSDAAAPAKVILTQTEIDLLEGAYLSTLTSAGEAKSYVYDPAVAGNVYFLVGLNANVTVYGAISPIAEVTSVATGTSATLRLRKGTYPSITDYVTLTGAGDIAAASVTESRTYVYTWVNKESGFEFESGPSAPSDIVDVHYEQTVSLSGFATAPTGYIVTHKRLYRSVSGVFLFVTELEAGTKNYTDTLLSDELSEELPTTNWLPPPANLAGLINLPNGMMAGFVGRDVYFCDPYHPHAWPLNYMQSVDYPVVGLGRMDTTLAVLTTGTPYFIQGTSPESMAVVKSDLEQSCASKRSIVSQNGVVIYASPDGLVVLTPGGSKVITENMFTRAQWQTYFKPTSIHAYMHDMKYVAFYNNGTTSGGFIFDMTTSQFILHDIYAEAGYNDLQRDQLFIASSDRSVKKWLEGTAKSYIWRSKKFTLPSVTGFNYAQLGAEVYPVTAKFYMDSALIYTKTVADRDVFRLPVMQGRDVEVQFEGSSEIFFFAMAQAMEELANV